MPDLHSQIQVRVRHHAMKLNCVGSTQFILKNEFMFHPVTQWILREGFLKNLQYVAGAPLGFIRYLKKNFFFFFDLFNAAYKARIYESFQSAIKRFLEKAEFKVYLILSH